MEIKHNWHKMQRGRKPHAHSNYVKGPMNLYGKEEVIDGMSSWLWRVMCGHHWRVMVKNMTQLVAAGY